MTAKTHIDMLASHYIESLGLRAVLRDVNVFVKTVIIHTLEENKELTAKKPVNFMPVKVVQEWNEFILQPFFFFRRVTPSTIKSYSGDNLKEIKGWERGNRNEVKVCSWWNVNTKVAANLITQPLNQTMPWHGALKSLYYTIVSANWSCKYWPNFHNNLFACWTWTHF